MVDAVMRETKTATYIVRGDLVDWPGKITLDGVLIERVEDFKVFNGGTCYTRVKPGFSL
jgi:hypothetical protein